MKIVFISQNVTPGLLIFRKSLIQELVKLGHIVYAFAIDYSDDSKNQILDIGAIPVEYSLSRTGLNPFSDLCATYKLYKLLKNINPDLVFSFFAKPVIYGAIAAKLAGIKNSIGMLEGLGFSFTEQPDFQPIKTRLIRFIQVQLFKISIPLLDKIIFLNQDDPEDLMVRYKIKVKKQEILGGIGIDLKDYPHSLPLINKGVRFLFVGRLLKEKGIYEYIGAAKVLKKRFPNSSFIVIGSLDCNNPGGLTKEELNDLINNDFIIYSGYVENVADWISSSSVFVLPSYREGLPRSIQEAMAVGRAIITTDVPGCRETVINNVNGFIVPPWNISALVDAMTFFVENPSYIISMGIMSHKIAYERFDSNKVNYKLMEMLKVDY